MVHYKRPQGRTSIRITHSAIEHRSVPVEDLPPGGEERDRKSVVFLGKNGETNPFHFRWQEEGSTKGHRAGKEKAMPDGRRKRRHSANRAKQQWYARHRAIRFSRRFLGTAIA
jgi:hypothetical protein